MNKANDKLSDLPVNIVKTVSGPPPALRPITTTGNAANRVDITFLGDGYTSSEIGTYTAHIQSYLSYIFNDTALTQPFGRYEKFFNIWAIDVISNQSGADNPGTGIVRDTALDASYYFDGVTERLLYVNDSKAEAALNSALSGTGIGAEMRYVVVNDTTYGGGGGFFGVYAGGNNFAREVALHEIGHSFAGLADEYGGNTGTYSGAEPSAINVTKNSAGAKWSEWLGYSDPILGVVGAYEGGLYYDHGVYRPTADSKMRSLDRPFDPIAREEFIHKFYQFVDPLDSYDSNVGSKSNIRSLSVDVIDPDVIHVDWTVNGQTFVNAGETFSLATHGFTRGTYSVTARAYDPTDWVRGDRSDLEQSVSWHVVNQIVNRLTSTDDFNGDGTSDILWRRGSDGWVAIWDVQNGQKVGGHDLGPLSPSAWKEKGASDFNGDGTSDILWQRPTDGWVAIWDIANGQKIGGHDLGPLNPGQWEFKETGDFNRDGTADILWQRPTDGWVAIWDIANGQKIGGHDLGPLNPGQWQFKGTGDFNGDGTSDILWQRPSDGWVAIWDIGNGQKIGGHDLGPLNPSQWQFKGTGDFNGDGTSDILWQRPSDGWVAIWDIGNGQKIGGHDLGPLSPSQWQFKETGDFNGDGTSDILWQRPTDGWVAIWDIANGQKIGGHDLGPIDPNTWHLV